LSEKRDYKRIIVKVGTSTLTHSTGRLDLRRVDRLVRTLCDLKNSGREVVLVTSGAIAVGVSKLGLDGKPDDIPSKQAAAAVGQCELMFIYDKFFSEYGHTTAQVLLTKNVISDPHGKENVINTMEAILRMGGVPIVNENDTVSYEEIVYGDNDTLSAVVAVLCRADLLILLSDIDGLYTADPHTDPGAELIREVRGVTDDIRALAGDSLSGVGTGGMTTKLHAAEIANEAGIDMIIMNGEEPLDLYDIFSSGIRGTVFYAAEPSKE